MSWKWMKSYNFFSPYFYGVTLHVNFYYIYLQKLQLEPYYENNHDSVDSIGALESFKRCTKASIIVFLMALLKESNKMAVLGEWKSNSISTSARQPLIRGVKCHEYAIALQKVVFSATDTTAFGSSHDTSYVTVSREERRRCSKVRAATREFSFKETYLQGLYNSSNRVRTQDTFVHLSQQRKHPCDEKVGDEICLHSALYSQVHR